MSDSDNKKILDAIAQLGKRIDDVHNEIKDVRIELGARIEEVNTNLSARIEEVNTNLSTRIEEVNTKVNARMDNLESSVNKRFDAVNARIDAHHRTKCSGGNGTRKPKWEQRVEALEKRADNTDKIINNHEQRITKFEIKK